VADRQRYLSGKEKGALGDDETQAGGVLSSKARIRLAID